MVIGDFNNVLDRAGGNQVQESEYQDMEKMMGDFGLYAHDTIGIHFTWSNGIIHSRIDYALCNRNWFLQFPSCTIEILNAHIYDHKPLKVHPRGHSVKNFQAHFKFQNHLTDNPSSYLVWRAIGKLRMLVFPCIGYRNL
ncbi:unnamed protein product [Vicia faba]|uniref:Uncharacterized protein n=1 Tax=Vicia faba TaxID=3906 RepID=A0AAV1B2H0_VICFA|nr:unnamed protein product [Vicia faba]